MSVNVYLYQAALYCEPCGKAIQGRLGNRASIAVPGDSDDYPQGPYPDGGDEADTPQHCAACNVHLENELTGDGHAYVREHVSAAFVDDGKWLVGPYHEHVARCLDDAGKPVLATWERFYQTMPQPDDDDNGD